MFVSEMIRFYLNIKNGDPGASRTRNLFLRTELLYPIELPGQAIKTARVRLKSTSAPPL